MLEYFLLLLSPEAHPLRPPPMPALEMTRVNLYLDKYLFTPVVKPLKILSVPHDGILWFEYPVILVREDQKS